MGWPIKKKYTNRHKILSVLYDKSVEYGYPGAELYDSLITFTEIVSAAKISDVELRNELAFLAIEKEFFSDDLNYVTHYGITRTGKAAFVDKKYLNLGKEDFWSTTKNYIALIAIVISIISVGWNIYSSSQIGKLKDRIEKLEKKRNEINKTTRTTNR